MRFNDDIKLPLFWHGLHFYWSSIGLRILAKYQVGIVSWQSIIG